MFNPIKVNSNEFTFNPRRMKNGKFYHFVWEGVDCFAMSKNKKDVNFYSLTPEGHISGLNEARWDTNGELA